MKKIALALIAVLALGIAVPAVAARRADPSAASKAESMDKAKWFKVLITDTDTKKVKVRITLPLTLVEAIVRNSRDSRVRLREHDCDLDFKALWKELKENPPMTFIEVEEHDQLIKVWIE